MTTAERSSRFVTWIGHFPFIARRMMALSAIGLLFSTATLAEDQGFSALVNQIESHYNLKRTKVPLFGLVKPLCKLAGPTGTKTLDLAIFEEQDLSSVLDSSDFESLAARALGNGWCPFVRVHSRRDGERTCIYAKDGGKDCRLIILTLERSEAVIMQVKLDPEKLMQWLEDPQRMGAEDGMGSKEDLDE